MAPTNALLLWLVLLIVLWRYDGKHQPSLPFAGWLALVWLFIVASRLPSQWLAGSLTVAGGSVEEGNELDRNVYLAVILITLLVLKRLRISWSGFAGANTAITLMLFYGLLSATWAEVPFVALKRWFRDLGTYLVVAALIVSANETWARQSLLRRLFFVTVPLSIVIIKYYPEIGREYSPWTGQAYSIGVTTSKNMLGVLGMLSALYFLWDLLRQEKISLKFGRHRIIIVDLCLLAMSLWLLFESGSATSIVCFTLGSSIILAAQTPIVKKYPRILTIGVPVALSVYLSLQTVFDIDLLAELALLVGRNPDLTGRTHIWHVVLAVGTNPLFGTGYENFWLGSRLEYLNRETGGVNHAHNGYLEFYLNLGGLGLALLAAVMWSSYRSISQDFRRNPVHLALPLALWTILLFYNVTEAAFRGHLLWVTFIVMALQPPTERERTST